MKVKDLIENCVKHEIFYIKILSYFEEELIVSNREIYDCSTYQSLKNKVVKYWSFDENPEYGDCRIDVYI